MNINNHRKKVGDEEWNSLWVGFVGLIRICLLIFFTSV